MAATRELEETGTAVAARLRSAVPNALSLCRLALGIAFPWTPAGWRGGVVVTAALTDFLDGFASRRLHAASSSGRILDPVADKAFVAAVLATLVAEGQLRWWQMVLLGLRDLTVLAGICWVLVRRRWSALGRMGPRLLGKATTAAQLVFLLAVLLCPPYRDSLFLLTALLSGLAAGDYCWAFLSQGPDNQSAARFQGAPAPFGS